MKEARGLLAAVTFLTRLPVPGAGALDADDVRRAALSFPVVGACIGAGVGVLADRLALRLSAPLAAGIAVAAGTLVTGALHVDALADTADGAGAHTRERALEVMRDPGVGAFGATAISLDMLIKVAALAALAERERGRVVRSAAVAGALSRAVPVALAAALPYARTGAGTGLAVTETSGARALGAGGAALFVAVCCAGGEGLTLAAVAAALALVCARVGRRRLGGVTGDTLGAGLELTETAVLVAAVALGGGR